jgi:hypothetical protein
MNKIPRDTDTGSLLNELSVMEAALKSAGKQYNEADPLAHDKHGFPIKETLAEEIHDLYSEIGHVQGLIERKLAAELAQELGV